MSQRDVAQNWRGGAMSAPAMGERRIVILIMYEPSTPVPFGSAAVAARKTGIIHSDIYCLRGVGLETSSPSIA